MTGHMMAGHVMAGHVMSDHVTVGHGVEIQFAARDAAGIVVRTRSFRHARCRSVYFSAPKSGRAE